MLGEMRLLQKRGVARLAGAATAGTVAGGYATASNSRSTRRNVVLQRRRYVAEYDKRLCHVGLAIISSNMPDNLQHHAKLC